MNEVLANLYALTGEEKYLKIAQRFNHMAVLGPASKRRGQAHRPARQHADPQVHRHGPAVRTDRRGVAQDGVDVLLGHGRQGAFLRHRRQQRRRDVLAQGEALRGPRPEHHRDLQHLQHAQAHAAPVLLGPAGRVRRLLRAGPVQPHPRLAESRDGHDVLLRAAAVRLAQGLQHARLDSLLVLHGHGRGEPRQVRRQHLLPRRRQDALREPVHRLRAELEGQGPQAAPGDEVSRARRPASWRSPARSPSS